MNAIGKFGNFMMNIRLFPLAQRLIFVLFCVVSLIRILLVLLVILVVLLVVFLVILFHGFHPPFICQALNSPRVDLSGRRKAIAAVNAMERAVAIKQKSTNLPSHRL